MINIVFEEVFPMYVNSYADVISIPFESAELERRTDDLRIADGKIPMFKEDDKGRRDYEGWYEFRLIVDRETGEPKEVEAWGEQVSEEDAGEYRIKLTEEEKLEAKKALERELESTHMTLQELAEIE